MNNFNVTHYNKYNVYNMALPDSQDPEQQMAPMVDFVNSQHSTPGKGDSALTAFLRSKQQQKLSGAQHTLSGTQHTNSTSDSFAQELDWEDDEHVPEDESIVSIDINGLENGLFALSTNYEVSDDESIVSIDIIDDIKNNLIFLSSYSNETKEWGDDDDVPDGESIVPIDISNEIKNDLIPLSSYNEDAVDEALKWTESFMDHDNDTDEESIEKAHLHDSISSFEKLTHSMARSATTRQELARQISEKSLGSTTSTARTTEISSQHSFNYHDSPQLQTSLWPSSSSSHSSTSTSGLSRHRINKAPSLRSNLIRRHSNRSLSRQDITKGLNGSLDSISLHGISSRKNLSPSIKVSQETSRSLMDGSSNPSLRVKARRAQNVNKRRIMLDHHFVAAASKLKSKKDQQWAFLTICVIKIAT